ncbi:hypothetical protein LXL04_021353 [Taraxacum kok-saghyz]
MMSGASKRDENWNSQMGESCGAEMPSTSMNSVGSEGSSEYSKTLELGRAVGYQLEGSEELLRALMKGEKGARGKQ